MVDRLLIAEDDQDIIEILRLYLESEGFEVVTARDGQEAWQFFQERHFDLIILDIMMPYLNGYELTQRMREASAVPILILSAKNQDMEKILGLNMGADDFMTKPFNPLEVVARVKSNLRRYKQLGQIEANPVGIFRVGDLCLDMQQMELKKAGQVIKLTAMELRILNILMQNPGQIFTKVQLYERINGEYFESDDNTMMVHISNLREKIEDDPRKPRYIKTLRGVGYKFDNLG